MRRANSALLLGVLAVFFVGSNTAWAQNDDAPVSDTSAPPPPPDEFADKELKDDLDSKLGVGLRIRQLFVPEGIIELFLEDVPSGVSTTGFGLEIVRRKGDFDIVVGLEFENVSPDDGLYLEKGDTPGLPGEDPDFVEFQDFATAGVDVSFVWHAEIAPKVDFRYGAGIGLALVLGDIIQTDTNCSTVGEIGSCSKDINGEQVNEKNEDVPPVVPIVNLLVGARIEVLPQLTVNLEGGLRAPLFFFGIGTTYLF